MRYKTVTWEQGTNEFYPPGSATKQLTTCYMVTVECIPNWFARKVLGQQSFLVDCYWDKFSDWRDAKSGDKIEQTTYANYDDWGAGKRLGDYLDGGRLLRERLKANKRMIAKINKAKKS